MFVNSRGTFAVSVFSLPVTNKALSQKTLYPYKKINNSEFAIPTAFIGSTKVGSATRHTLPQHPPNWSAQFVCTPFTLEVKPVSLALTLRALAQLVINLYNATTNGLEGKF